MGIPLENFTVNLQRNYTNINSSYGFIPGDKRIARINTISTHRSSTDHTLTQGQIVNTGNYSKTYNITVILYSK